VPKYEKTETCLAGAGTLLLEFGTLSRLTGDPTYEVPIHTLPNALPKELKKGYVIVLASVRRLLTELCIHSGHGENLTRTLWVL